MSYDSKQSIVLRLATPRDLADQLKWLTLFRVTLVTVLLGATVTFNLQDDTELSDRLYVYVYYLCTVTYIVSFLYTVALRFLRTQRQHLVLTFVQFTGDVLFAAALVLVTGGTDSVFTFFFSLVIIGGAIVLFRPGALYLAALSTTLLLSIGLIELYDIGEGSFIKIHRLAFLPARIAEEAGRWRRVAYNVSINGVAFFAVGLLASWLSEQLRRSAQQLHSQRERLEELRVLHHHIVNSVPTGLISTDRQQLVTFINDAGARILGLEPGEIVDRHITQFFPDLTRVLDSDQELPDVIRDESVLPQDRRRRYLGWTLSPLRDAGGLLIGHTFMFQDITRVRELEHSMRRSEKMAAIGELSAAIAHEIRNPLAAISGCVQMLSGGATTTDADRRLMEIVQRETDTLNGWITDFLNYSRPAPMRSEVFDLDQLARDALAVFRNDESVRSRGIEVRFRGIGPAHVLGDPSRIKQVLWNLLTNAEQAMAAGGGIDVEIAASIATSRPQVELQVRDEGRGIPPEDQERIFEPFFTTKERGTGLGLAVIHRIIEDHDGRIAVDSEVGQGTSFRVTLPLTAPRVATIEEGMRAR